jgi:hypothetical protein
MSLPAKFNQPGSGSMFRPILLSKKETHGQLVLPKMNVFFTMLALFCCISALPVIGWGKNWLSIFSRNEAELADLNPLKQVDKQVKEGNLKQIIGQTSAVNEASDKRDELNRQYQELAAMMEIYIKANNQNPLQNKYSMQIELTLEKVGDHRNFDLDSIKKVRDLWYLWKGAATNELKRKN